MFAMRHSDERRRHYQFLNLIRALIFTCVFVPMMSFASTGIRALDTPAIAAYSPNKVALVAITSVGSRLVAVGEHGVIIYSDDSGRTWRQAKVPVDVTLTTVKFAGSSNGWAAGNYGVILHTADGGLTWQEQLNGLQANQLTMAAAQSVAADDPSSLGAPLATKRAAAFLASGPDKPFLSIVVLDANNVLVFGAYRMVMKTSNGGKNWIDWSLHIGDSLSHNLYDAALVGNDLYVVGEGGLVFCSTDHGMTFPPVTAPVAATLFFVLPARPRGVLVGGVAGLAFNSQDNGATWQPVNLQTSANITAGITLRSGVILLASEGGTLYASNDSGRTFTSLPQVQPMALYDLAQASNGNIVLVGNSGVVVLPSTDVGVSQSGD